MTARISLLAAGMVQFVSSTQALVGYHTICRQEARWRCRALLSSSGRMLTVWRRRMYWLQLMLLVLLSIGTWRVASACIRFKRWVSVERSEALSKFEIEREDDAAFVPSQDKHLLTATKTLTHSHAFSLFWFCILQFIIHPFIHSYSLSSFRKTIKFSPSISEQTQPNSQPLGKTWQSACTTKVQNNASPLWIVAQAMESQVPLATRIEFLLSNFTILIQICFYPAAGTIQFNSGMLELVYQSVLSTALICAVKR
jgi:hypothetical protein